MFCRPRSGRRLKGVVPIGKYIYLIVGESGSGKSTLAELLCHNRGMRQLWSYTTRPKRSASEAGHIFVSSFDSTTPCAAYTKFNGYEYWATPEQVERADVYVIDPAGLEWMLKFYRGNKIPVVIFVDVTRRNRKRRMRKRGDSRQQIRDRLQHDELAFRDFRRRILRCDTRFRFVTIDNNGSDGGERLLDAVDALEDSNENPA